MSTVSNTYSRKASPAANGNHFYILNPEYRLKSDIKRVLLYKKDTDPIKRDDLTDFLGFVHPLYAVLFTLFDGEKKCSPANCQNENCAPNQDYVKVPAL